MKKVLMVLLSLIIVVGIAGCGPSAKDEAKQFNDTYYVKGFENGLLVEFGKTLDEMIKIHGNTPAADEALLKSDIPQKFAAYVDTVKNAKVENKEVIPLKEDLAKYVNAYNETFIALSKDDRDAASAAFDNRQKAQFDYENEYSKITTGKGLPVINAPSGQYYASVASNVSFAITSVKESNSIGSGYFVEKPQGKFIAVKIFVYNNQKDAITVDSNSFHLVDKEGHQFSVSTNGMTAIQLSEGHNKGFLSQLNPTMSMEPTFVFDVPANAKLSAYELEARGGMTGDKVKMPLKVRKTGY